MARALHGEQEFTYDATVHAGDLLTFTATRFTATTRPGQEGETLVDLEGRLEDGTVTVQGRTLLRSRR